MNLTHTERLSMLPAGTKSEYPQIEAENDTPAASGFRKCTPPPTPNEIKYQTPNTLRNLCAIATCRIRCLVRPRWNPALNFGARGRVGGDIQNRSQGNRRRTSTQTPNNASASAQQTRTSGKPHCFLTKRYRTQLAVLTWRMAGKKRTMLCASGCTDVRSCRTREATVRNRRN